MNRVAAPDGRGPLLSRRAGTLSKGQTPHGQAHVYVRWPPDEDQR